jgi:hypothetical protein
MHSYSPSSRRQWGFDIDDNTAVIQRAKLKLDRLGRGEALHALKQTLDTAPRGYLTSSDIINKHVPTDLIKSPVDVVADFLEEVIRQVTSHFEADIGCRFLAGSSPLEAARLRFQKRQLDSEPSRAGPAIKLKIAIRADGNTQCHFDHIEKIGRDSRTAVDDPPREQRAAFPIPIDIVITHPAVCHSNLLPENHQFRLALDLGLGRQGQEQYI